MYYDPPYYNDRPCGNLCWFCKKSAAKNGNDCSWNRCFEPISGWDAIPVAYPRDRHTAILSQCVIRCPEFDFLDGSGKYDTSDRTWQYLKHDDGTPVYEKIFECLVVTREV